MDTWSVAKLALDSLFAILMAGTITGFLYYREKKLQSKFVDTLARSLEWGLDQRPATPEPIRLHTPTAAPISRRKSVVEAIYEPQKRIVKTPPVKMNRAERYLEAVRMYRQGLDRNEIERNLGISFMELELLGRMK